MTQSLCAASRILSELGAVPTGALPVFLLGSRVCELWTVSGLVLC